MFRYWTAIGLAAAGLSGCLYDETKAHVPEPPEPPEPSRISTTQENGLSVSEVDVSEVDVSEVDASEVYASDWVYWDLDERRELDLEEPDADSSWDLALRRKEIKANTGVHAWALEGAHFSAVTKAPEELDKMLEAGIAWDALEEDELEVLPRNLVYVVRTTEGTELKLELLHYGATDESEATWVVAWAPLARVNPCPEFSSSEPDPETRIRTTTIEASSSDEDWAPQFVYFDLDQAKSVCPESPNQDTSWDLAFKLNVMNSNDNAEGVRIATVQGKLEEIYEAPDTDEYEQTPSESGWEWATVEGNQHLPLDNLVYVVRTAAYEYFAVSIRQYSGGRMSSRYVIEWKPIEGPPNPSPIQ